MIFPAHVRAWIAPLSSLLWERHALCQLWHMVLWADHREGGLQTVAATLCRCLTALAMDGMAHRWNTIKMAVFYRVPQSVRVRAVRTAFV